MTADPWAPRVIAALDPSILAAQQLAASLTPAAEAAAAEKRMLEEVLAYAIHDWKTKRNLSVEDMLNLPDPEPLIGGNILYTATSAWLVGAPGTYKSFLALDWACCIATGTQWLGRDVKQGSVLYLTLEGSAGTGKRLRAWMDARGVDQALLSKSITFVRQANLLDLGDRAMLLEDVAMAKYALIVIDTQARATPGAEENSKDAMDPFVQLLTGFSQVHGATVLTIHHSPKGGNDPSRGTGSLEGAADTMLWIKKKDPLQIDLNLYKHKDTESGQDIPLEFLEHLDSLIPTNGVPEDLMDNNTRMKDPQFQQLLFGALADLEVAGEIGMSRSELCREIIANAHKIGVEISRPSIYRILNDMADRGYTVLMGGSGEDRRGARTVLASAGRAKLESQREGDDQQSAF